jgi:molybdopterin-guanine dinucleotide biosynthesis protein
MRSDRVPLLWLCGPSGVGKSTVGWAIFTQLTRSGIKAAYVDADQLGLCYPTPTGDPENNQVKAGNLSVIWPNFRAAGIRCLIVSGCVDAADEMRTYTSRLRDADVTVCRLRANSAQLRQRFVGRGWNTHLADEVVREAEMLERSGITDLCVDTSGLTASDVAQLVRKRAGGWPTLPECCHQPRPSLIIKDRSLAEEMSPVSSGPPVLWLCGPRGVGKSTVGWEIFMRIVQSGVKAAYLGLEQIGFCRPPSDDDPDNHHLTAANLKAMWDTFQSEGARCLIMTGGVPDRDTVRICANALPDSAMTLCRLCAGPERLRERIVRRGRGGGPRIPGDELLGRPTEFLHRVAADAAREADELDRVQLGDLSIDTDHRTVERVAQLVLAQTGFPHPSPD